MATIEHIDNFQVRSEDKFFFDNNIWMILFSSAIAGSRLTEQRIYGKLLREIQSARATIFINSLVASEYINANLRLAFARWRMRPENVGKSDYKRDYVPTISFRGNRELAYEELSQILKCSYKKSDDFNVIKIEDLSDLGERMDFNDAYYSTYCRINNLIMVTDDKDMFQNQETFRILTK